MNIRILMGVISIITMVGAVSVSTYAFFSDQGTDTGNIFSSGSLTMKLSDDNQTDIDDVTTTWGNSNMAPGTTFSGDLKIKNSGSIPANHIELKFTNLVTEGAGPGLIDTTPMDKVIELTTFSWDTNGDGAPETDLLSATTDTNGNTIIDLDDLENQVADDFDNLSFAGTQNTNHVLRIAGRLHPTLALDQHQGDSVNMSLTVTMNQDASQ